MALYKYNGVLLKSKESILLKEKEDFVKLSYFNNYTNSIDTPVYGEPYTISNNGHLIKNTMVINGITYPSLKLYGSGYWCNFDMGLDFNEVESITIDLFSRLNVDGGWASPCSPFNAWPAFWGDNWGGDRGSGVTNTVSSPIVTIYQNPNLRDLYADSWYMRVNNNITANVIFHLAYVYKWINSDMIEQKIYVNGELQTIINIPKTFLTENKIGMDSNYSSSCYVEFSQVAIRVGDYSINEGQNFPVPTEPYHNWE